jgi:hypothetical protein
MFQESTITINELIAGTPPKVEEPIAELVSKNKDAKMMSKYKNYITASGSTPSTAPDSNSTEKIDELLEKEKQNMNSEPWNKLDKRLKIQKLHAYAEKYGRENSLPLKEVKALKTFFSECLTKDKLAKVKDVDYDRELGAITNITTLCLNVGTRTFTLRNLEKKVSTLKMLTPKKSVSQNDTDI